MPSPAPDAIEIAEVPERHRYEARIEGAVAGVAMIRRRPGLVIFLHTEVDPRYEGRGVGSALAKGSLDLVRAAGDRVEPRCPFIAAWIRRHKDYADLVVDA